MNEGAYGAPKQNDGANGAPKEASGVAVAMGVANGWRGPMKMLHTGSNPTPGFHERVKGEGTGSANGLTV